MAEKTYTVTIAATVTLTVQGEVEIVAENKTDAREQIESDPEAHVEELINQGFSIDQIPEFKIESIEKAE